MNIFETVNDSHSCCCAPPIAETVLPPSTLTVHTPPLALLSMMEWSIELAEGVGAATGARFFSPCRGVSQS
jgi:hypothetical protein